MCRCCCRPNANFRCASRLLLGWWCANALVEAIWLWARESLSDRSPCRLSNSDNETGPWAYLLWTPWCYKNTWSYRKAFLLAWIPFRRNALLALCTNKTCQLLINLLWSLSWDRRGGVSWFSNLIFTLVTGLTNPRLVRTWQLWSLSWDRRGGVSWFSNLIFTLVTGLTNPRLVRDVTRVKIKLENHDTPPLLSRTSPQLSRPHQSRVGEAGDKSKN